MRSDNGQFTLVEEIPPGTTDVSRVAQKTGKTKMGKKMEEHFPMSFSENGRNMGETKPLFLMGISRYARKWWGVF